MKKQNNRKYREVVFQDIRTGKSFLSRSTVETDKRMVWDGKEYPLVRLDVSSFSHSAYGEQVEALPSSRIAEFRRRYKQNAN